MPGSVQHLGGDRYWVRIYAGVHPVTGKQRARSRSFRAANMREARKIADGHIVALQAELDEAKLQSGTIRELAREWMELKRRQGRSPATLQGYDVIVARIVKRFGNRKVADLTGRDVDRWYGELAEPGKGDDEGMSAATIQHHHAVLRAMLRQGERWDMVSRVATRQSSPPSVLRHEINPPTDAALGLLMADTAGDFANAVRILAGTGLRRGELCGLAWSDLVGDQLTVRRSVLELKGGELHVKTTKGRKPRTLTVGADVLAAFANQRAHLEAMAAAMEVVLPADGPVFADLKRDPSGMRPRRPWWVSNQWIQLRDRHGVSFRLHDLRHWNASKMLDSGVPLATAAQRLGHAQPSTTSNIYGHSIAGADRSAAELLSGALG